MATVPHQFIVVHSVSEYKKVVCVEMLKAVVQDGECNENAMVLKTHATLLSHSDCGPKTKHLYQTSDFITLCWKPDGTEHLNTGFITATWHIHEY